jgi:phage terminase large subunit GpA-like protein
LLASNVQPTSPPEFVFPEAVVALQDRKLKLLQPPPPLKVSEWAKQYRSLSRKDSARPGRWRSEPHQDEIMDACCDPAVRKVVVMAASQVVGKSQMMNNIIGRYIDVDPSNMLVMHPTIAAAEKWSIGRLDPLIQETERLHDQIQPRKSRSIGGRILHRQFCGGRMSSVGSDAPADLPRGRSGSSWRRGQPSRRSSVHDRDGIR